MSGRRVLLIEPNYKNKYPPMGLMKLAMYYRLQGDEVRFWKGRFSDLIADELARECFKVIEHDVSDPQLLKRLRFEWSDIIRYIRVGKLVADSNLSTLVEESAEIKSGLQDVRKKFTSRDYYKNPRWDIVGVTTLFTFYWDITIRTIEFAKRICKDVRNVQVGGVLASVHPKRLEQETGVKPHVGILNINHFKGDVPFRKPYSDVAIDELPLDYSILDEIDYEYPESDAFYGYATRGCVNHCKFCVVPIIEPKYESFIPLEGKVRQVKERFGDQRNMLLLDNNVFASKRFDDIIDEIRSCGFGRGSKFIRPNQMELVIRQLRDDWNVRGGLRRVERLLREFCDATHKRKCVDDGQAQARNVIHESGLLRPGVATVETVLSIWPLIRSAYDEWHKKRTHAICRYVDFNQGLDARLATKEKMEKLATIGIKPLRIAFDNWNLRDVYVRAVRLAANSGIKSLSNYLLYNFQDRPEDLYKRLLLNVDLCEELGVNIYSFPMKYHPITDEKWFSNRDYIGRFWNRKYIRAIQSILNSTHGKVGRGRAFFYKAFGRNLKEFQEILLMPEVFIVNRIDAEQAGIINEWRESLNGLVRECRLMVESIVKGNKFDDRMLSGYTQPVKEFLRYYQMTKKDIKSVGKRQRKRVIKKYILGCSTGVSRMGKSLLSSK